MVFKGYRQPLVQEDMWDLNEENSTAQISGSFQGHMQKELGKARIRYQNKLKKRPPAEKRQKVQDESHSNGLGKGISQDVLMMVKWIVS